MVRLKEIIFWFHIISTLFLNRIFFSLMMIFFFCRPDLFLGAALPCSSGFRSPDVVLAGGALAYKSDANTPTDASN